MEPLNELDGLAIAAGALDSEAAAGTPQAMAFAQEEAAAMSMADMNGRAVAGVLEMAAPLIAPLYPRVAAVYTPEACANIGNALGPVMAKYNIDLGEWGGKYKEELTAAFVCVPIAMATVKALREDVAEREAAKPATAPAVAEAVARPGPLKPGDYGYTEPAA